MSVQALTLSYGLANGSAYTGTCTRQNPGSEPASFTGDGAVMTAPLSSDPDGTWTLTVVSQGWSFTTDTWDGTGFREFTPADVYPAMTATSIPDPPPDPVATLAAFAASLGVAGAALLHTLARQVSDAMRFGSVVQSAFPISVPAGQSAVAVIPPLVNIDYADRLTLYVRSAKANAEPDQSLTLALYFCSSEPKSVAEAQAGRVAVPPVDVPMIPVLTGTAPTATSVR